MFSLIVMVMDEAKHMFSENIGYFKLRSRHKTKYTNKIHIRRQFYLQEDTYFCPSTSGIYIPMPHNKNLSVRKEDLISLFHS